MLLFKSIVFDEQNIAECQINYSGSGNGLVWNKYVND